ncbi:hypothetical protein DAETH_05540 [Deinococcus aetherius]|uniref:Uncharacterized protein n=1 Tax=Deinococcus aetherius TaxID=200252 RepID=A0ABM8AA98_9DEIO|nr:hypothetical protein DAETH_05540 [Deinococcus aetherius]
MTPGKRPIRQNRRDILRAFFVLERETGRTAFKYSEELRKKAPHVDPSTLGKEGRSHLYALSSLGRQRVKEPGLDKD